MFESKGLGDLAQGGPVAGQRRGDGADEGPNKRRKTETGLVQLVGGYTDESESEPPNDNNAGTSGGIAILAGYESDEIKEADSVEEELAQGSDTPNS